MPATRHENKRVVRLEIARVAFGANPALSWIHTKRDVSIACVFDVARIVNFVVIEYKIFLSRILVL